MLKVAPCSCRAKLCKQPKPSWAKHMHRGQIHFSACWNTETHQWMDSSHQHSFQSPSSHWETTTRTRTCLLQCSSRQTRTVTKTTKAIPRQKHQTKALTASRSHSPLPSTNTDVGNCPSADQQGPRSSQQYHRWGSQRVVCKWILWHFTTFELRWNSFCWINILGDVSKVLCGLKAPLTQWRFCDSWVSELTVYLSRDCCTVNFGSGTELMAALSRIWVLCTSLYFFPFPIFPSLCSCCLPSSCLPCPSSSSLSSSVLATSSHKPYSKHFKWNWEFYTRTCTGKDR